jgi:cell division protease FtsH
MSKKPADRDELFDRRTRAPQERGPDSEKTYVERRQNRTRRYWRRARLAIPIGLFIFWIFMMATNNAVLNISVTILAFVGRLVFVVMFIIIQFVAMFWFLGRTRSYDIYPDRTNKGLNYTDYPGQPELLERAKQIVRLLQGVSKFETMGGEPLTGLLLEGPPGTGKTRLAQVISTEANVPFFYVDGSSMMSMFMGMGNFKVMRFYAKARKAAKEYGASIIFIDELDSIGGSRGMVSTTGAAVDAAGGTNHPGVLGIMMGGMAGGGGMGLLSTLLVEMDGFGHEHGAKANRREFFWKLRHLHLIILGRPVPPVTNPNKRVLTIGATNRVSVLDPALLRDGRFDVQIRVDIPDAEGRKAIIKYYLDQMAHDDSVNMGRLMQDMVGFTPARINGVLNDALRNALFDNRDKMSYEDILQATAEKAVGLRQPVPNRLEEDRVKTAYHEAGHAIVQHALRRHKSRIMRLTIVRYGSAQGHMAPRPLHERPITSTSKTDLETRICISFAGRAAEQVFLGDITLGAGSDLRNVMATLLQMADSAMLGDYYIGYLQNNEYEEAPEIVKKKFDELYMRTVGIIEEHREAMEVLVGALLDKEELTGDQVMEILDQFDWDPIAGPPGITNGQEFGRHYVERVLNAEKGHQDPEGENGRQPQDEGTDETVGDPAGD